MGNQTFASFVVGSQSEPQRDPSKPNKFLKPGPEGQVGFNSQQEFLDAIADERYSAPGAEGEEYREAVQIVLRNSNLVNDPHSAEGKRAQAKADARKAADLEIFNEQVLNMMGKEDAQGRLLMDVSPIYRRQIEDFVKAHDAEIEAASPGRINGGTRLKHRVQFSGDDYNEVAKGIKDERDEQRKQAAREAADAIIRQAEQQYVDVLGTPVGDEDDSES